MSKKHPIIAVTGSSGAGTSSVKVAFEHMFHREGIKAAVIEGDSYHRFNRTEMKETMERHLKEGHEHFSHFGEEANLFQELQDTYRQYAEDGSGKWRLYLHNHEEAEPYSDLGLKPGEFTPWQDMTPDTDLMFYEGLHGCVVSDDVNMARYVDLKIGVVPVINLEWIQKIHRDTQMRGYSEEAVMDTILRRMHDYVHYIIPQFQHTDINFQRVPVVDTSDPIIARDIPTPDESLVVIRFKDPAQFNVDFPYLLQMLDRSWMSRRNSIVVPGGKMGLATELILTPILQNILEERRKLVKAEAA
ncbi:MAG: phosphoribulokinase [Rhodospirillales bacterium]|nr:phosphoribulokinase [Alphaproteobacteria bacterium]MBL6947363.1 phosphoribulokinase [Rhodospirillales bacterium]